MVWIDFEVRKQQGLPAWSTAPAVRFHRYEDGIDLFQRLRIIKFECPAFLGCVVLVKDTEVQRLLSVGAASAPRLERAGVFHSRLLIQIISVEDERLPFRIENAPVGLLCRPIT